MDERGCEDQNPVRVPMLKKAVTRNPPNQHHGGFDPSWSLSWSLIHDQAGERCSRQEEGERSASRAWFSDNFLGPDRMCVGLTEPRLIRLPCQNQRSRIKIRSDAEAPLRSLR